MRACFQDISGEYICNTNMVNSVQSALLLSPIDRKFSFVWLDTEINAVDVEYFRSLIKDFFTFERTDECVKHIQQSINDSITLIVNGKLAHSI